MLPIDPARHRGGSYTEIGDYDRHRRNKLADEQLMDR